MNFLKTMVMALAIFSFLSFSNDAFAAGKAAKDGEPEVHFVEMSPLIIPVINSHGVTQMISLVIAVEVDSQEKADRVTKYSPRLTDAYLSDLYGAFSHDMPDNDMIPVAYLKERLNKMSTKILGEDVVADVLLQVLQQRAT